MPSFLAIVAPTMMVAAEAIQNRSPSVACRVCCRLATVWLTISPTTL
jgi:hypothetical protein